MAELPVSSKTIRCELVDEWVTITGYKDGTEKCIFYKRHFAEDKKSKKEKKWLNCKQLSCPHNNGWQQESS